MKMYEITIGNNRTGKTTVLYTVHKYDISAILTDELTLISCKPVTI